MNPKEAESGMREIREAIEIAAPIEAVWKALTDAQEMTRWFPLEAGVNPDGTVWMSFGGDFKFTGRVELSEPPHRLRTVPVFPPGMEPPAKMATEVFLETRAGKTVVRLVQSGFLATAQWDEEFEGTQRGWQCQLRGLRHYLERHRGTPRRVAWARVMHDLPMMQAWARLISREGLLQEGSLDGLREGDRYKIRAATGDALEGTVAVLNPPRGFAATVDNLNGAFLMMHADDLPMRGVRDANVWFNTYGMASGGVEALQSRFQALLVRLFPQAK